MRMYRKFAIAGVMFGAIAMAPGTARADGSQYPSGAPAVQVGVPTFGNTSVPSTGPSQDYFRLPTLLEQSRVTVAAASSSSSGGYICLAGNVDNYNWNQHKCNLADEQWFNHNGSRLRFDAAFATSSAYLRVRHSFSGKPYEFTVEKIQHKLGMALKGGSTFKRNSRVTVSVRLTNGAPVPDGLLVSLITQVGGRNYRSNARTRGGLATFTLNLPASAEGKRGTMIAFSDEKPQYLPARATARVVSIVK